MELLGPNIKKTFLWIDCSYPLKKKKLSHNIFLHFTHSLRVRIPKLVSPDHGAMLTHWNCSRLKAIPRDQDKGWVESDPLSLPMGRSQRWQKARFNRHGGCLCVVKREAMGSFLIPVRVGESPSQARQLWKTRVEARLDTPKHAHDSIGRDLGGEREEATFWCSDT